MNCVNVKFTYLHLCREKSNAFECSFSDYETEFNHRFVFVDFCEFRNRKTDDKMREYLVGRSRGLIDDMI